MLLHIWYYVITIIYCLFVYVNCCMDNIKSFFNNYMHDNIIFWERKKERENIT